MFSNKDISDYYDQTEVHYRHFWKLDECLAIHYGIWEKDTRSFSEALLNVNQLVQQRGAVDKDQHVEDR